MSDPIAKAYKTAVLMVKQVEPHPTAGQFDIGERMQAELQAMQTVLLVQAINRLTKAVKENTAAVRGNVPAPSLGRDGVPIVRLSDE